MGEARLPPRMHKTVITTLASSSLNSLNSSSNSSHITTSHAINTISTTTNTTGSGIRPQGTPPPGPHLPCTPLTSRVNTQIWSLRLHLMLIPVLFKLATMAMEAITETVPFHLILRIYWAWHHLIWCSSLSKGLRLSLGPRSRHLHLGIWPMGSEFITRPKSLMTLRWQRGLGATIQPRLKELQADLTVIKNSLWPHLPMLKQTQQLQRKIGLWWLKTHWFRVVVFAIR